MIGGAVRRRWAWAAPLLLFLAVVLVAGLAFNVANLDSGGEALPDVPDAGGTDPSARGLVDANAVFNGILAVEVAVLVVAIGYFLAIRRREPRRKERVERHIDYLGSIASLVILLILIVLWPRISEGLQAPGDGGRDDGAGAGLPDVGWPEAAGAPAAIFLLAAIFVGFLVVAYIVRGSRVLRWPSSAVGPMFPRMAAAEVVQETIAELEIGGDVRQTILACFQRFCLLLGQRGIQDQRAMTPRELEVAAVRRLHVRPDDASTLAALFEEARYSEHPLEEPARDRAIRSLRDVRASLGA